MQGPLYRSSVGYSSKRVEMRLPIGIAEIGIADGVAAVQHHPVAHIDAAMRDSSDIRAHRAFKKHDVSGLRLVIRHGAAQAAQPLGSQPAGVVNTAVCEYETKPEQSKRVSGLAPPQT